tara:strand:- start:98 stop:829 length:732 start_codon:yes stop_codon:yes gene_type:complete
MAAYTYDNLVTDIRNYTEVDSNVLTAAICNRFIENVEQRILLDVPMDSDRKMATGNFATDDNTINAPAGCLFVRAVEVFDSTSSTDGNSVFLQKKDVSYLREYVAKLTGPSGGQTAQDVTGQPKYYAMFGGATGLTDSTSGGLLLAPTPDTTYAFRIYYNAQPTSLVTNTSGTYISRYFPQGLLYASLAEAYGFLKGPMDMLTLYENKYKQEVQKFAGTQLGRRRRDDYTDGTVRIPIKSPSP